MTWRLVYVAVVNDRIPLLSKRSYNISLHVSTMFSLSKSWLLWTTLQWILGYEYFLRYWFHFLNIYNIQLIDYMTALFLKFLKNLIDVVGYTCDPQGRMAATAWMSAWATRWTWSSSEGPFFFKKGIQNWRISILFPTVAEVFYNYTNNSQGLQFLHIFANIYYLWFIC